MRRPSPDRTDPATLGRQILREGSVTIRTVLAWQAPDLREALMRARIAGYGHLIVDGTVIETDRLRTPGPAEGVDLWWSGKTSNQRKRNRTPPVWGSTTDPPTGPTVVVAGQRSIGYISRRGTWTDIS
jgi:hypothetical protein